MHKTALRWVLGLMLVLVLVLELAITFALARRDRFDAAALQTRVESAGAAGPGLFMGFTTLATVVVLPRAVITLAGSALFGAWLMTCSTRRSKGAMPVVADDELFVAQSLSLPAPLMQVQDSPGLGLEVRVPREDPAPMLPRSNRILVQPTSSRDRSRMRGWQRTRHAGAAHAGAIAIFARIRQRPAWRSHHADHRGSKT